MTNGDGRKPARSLLNIALSVVIVHILLLFLFVQSRRGSIIFENNSGQELHALELDYFCEDTGTRTEVISVLEPGGRIARDVEHSMLELSAVRFTLAGIRYESAPVMAVAAHGRRETICVVTSSGGVSVRRGDGE